MVHEIAGTAPHQIANELNADGVPTKRGGKWYAATVHYIMHNKLYK